MRNFDRDNRGDGRGGYNPERSRMGRREMFKAVCSNCGKECEVPFRPTGSKPVFCSDCFEKQGGGSGSDSRRFDDRGPRRPRFDNSKGFDNRRPNQSSQPQNKEQFDALNAKLDKILAMLTPAPVVKAVVPEREAPKKKVSKKLTPASEE